MDPVIAKGTCFPLFAYEVAYAIDLDEAERRVVAGTERQTVKFKRRAPAYFEYRPAPLRVARDAESLDIAGYLFLGGLAGASSALGAGAQLTERPALARVAKTGAAAANFSGQRDNASHTP